MPINTLVNISKDSIKVFTESSKLLKPFIAKPLVKKVGNAKKSAKVVSPIRFSTFLNIESTTLLRKPSLSVTLSTFTPVSSAPEINKLKSCLTPIIETSLPKVPRDCCNCCVPCSTLPKLIRFKAFPISFILRMKAVVTTVTMEVCSAKVTILSVNSIICLEKNDKPRIAMENTEKAGDKPRITEANNIILCNAAGSFKASTKPSHKEVIVITPLLNSSINNETESLISVNLNINLRIASASSTNTGKPICNVRNRYWSNKDKAVTAWKPTDAKETKDLEIILVAWEVTEINDLKAEATTLKVSRNTCQYLALPKAIKDACNLSTIYSTGAIIAFSIRNLNFGALAGNIIITPRIKPRKASMKYGDNLTISWETFGNSLAKL